MPGFEDIMQWLTMMNPNAGAGAGAQAGVGGSMDPQAAMAILADPDAAAATMAKGGMNVGRQIANAAPGVGGGGDPAGAGRPDPTVPRIPPRFPVPPAPPGSDAGFRSIPAGAPPATGGFPPPAPPVGADVLDTIEGQQPLGAAPAVIPPSGAGWETPPGVTSAPGTSAPNLSEAIAAAGATGEPPPQPPLDLSGKAPPPPPGKSGLRSEAGDTERKDREDREAAGVGGEAAGKKKPPGEKKKDEKKTDWGKKLEGVLGALKQVAPPAPQVTAAPRPPAAPQPVPYRANPQTMQMLMQLLQGPAGAQAPTPTLSQLMGR